MECDMPDYRLDPCAGQKRDVSNRDWDVDQEYKRRCTQSPGQTSITTSVPLYLMPWESTSAEQLPNTIFRDLLGDQEMESSFTEIVDHHFNPLGTHHTEGLATRVDETAGSYTIKSQSSGGWGLEGCLKDTQDSSIICQPGQLASPAFSSRTAPAIAACLESSRFTQIDSSNFSQVSVTSASPYGRDVETTGTFHCSHISKYAVELGPKSNPIQVLQNTRLNQQTAMLALQKPQILTQQAKLVVDALSSFTGDEHSKIAPVRLQPYGDMLKLYFHDSGKYAGLVNLSSLCKLFQKFTVELSATLIASPTNLSKASKTNKNQLSSHEHSVRILLYGLKAEQCAIGEFLGGEDLFLQHPSAAECEDDEQYCNPHYLVRPGHKIPILDEFWVPFKNRILSANILNEVERNNLMHIFDSVDNFEAASNAISSSRLRTELKE
ncbi:MAG: hypothetical protein M1814_002784 [Vezdaea aestivalis]|nr:MAG: hypothetical protein M1814_002784 [Vezdaea aestivalis]